MKFETPELDERQNPNIPHESPTKDLWRMLGYFAIMLGIIWLIIELMVLAIPRMMTVKNEHDWLGWAGEYMVQEQAKTPNIKVEHNEELQGLANQLAEKMDLPKDVITVYINSDDVVNAYATFGGHIVLYQGLLNRLQTEESVVAVLAHEMAHVQHRDVLRGSSRGLLLSLALASLTGNNAVLNLAELEILRYQRDLEEHADTKAVETLHTLYGSSGDLLYAFQILHVDDNQHQHQDTPVWLLNHPKMTERMENIRHIAQNKGYALTVGHTPNRWKIAEK